MTATDLGRVALQARIVLSRVGVIPGVIAILLLLGTSTWIWFAINARDQGQQGQALMQERQRLRESSTNSVANLGFSAEQKLSEFYDVLGNRSETEQYLKTVFTIASQAGLSLDQGEYQSLFDKNSNTYRYQMLLPVKGSYGVIRVFCEKTLLALPFASLDELSFKRESVGEDTLDVNLRISLYLKDVLREPQEAGKAK
jgi:hypothetical protein